MAQKRSNVEIIEDILQIAKRGATKSRIVHGANLNYKLLNRYLDDLMKTGLVINPVGSQGIIKTTEKGMQFLNCCARLKEMLQGARVFRS